LAARPDDGLLELGVVTAANPVEWARTFGSVALGRTERSPFVQVTRGKKFRVRFDRKLRYEVDGGARKPVRDLRIKVHPGSITVCVPPGAANGTRGPRPAVTHPVAQGAASTFPAARR
jgi:diacylglycerol kinase family enzyme